MSIPNCLKLQPEQLNKLERFKEFVAKTVGVDWDELCEDYYLDGESPLTFSIFSTGGRDAIDVVRVRCPGALGGVEYECDLTIDDDGELSEFRAEDLILHQLY